MESTPPARPQVVLSIENDAITGRLLKAALASLSVEVHWVASLDEARDHLEDAALILLDLGLADTPKNQTYRRLRDMYGGPVLVISGHDDHLRRALEQGAQAGIPKAQPGFLNRLVEEVTRWTGLR